MGWYSTAFSRGAGPKHPAASRERYPQKAPVPAELGFPGNTQVPPDTPGLSLGWQKDQQAVAHGVLGPERSALGRMALCALPLPSPGWAGVPEPAPRGLVFPIGPGPEATPQSLKKPEEGCALKEAKLGW